MPTIGLSELEWVREVVREHIPGVADDAHELEPRSGVLCILGCPSHHLELLCDPKDSIFRLEHILFFVVLVFLLKTGLKQLLMVPVLLKSLLIFDKIDLKNVVEYTTLGGNIELRSLRGRRDQLEEKAHSLEEVLFTYPEIDITFLSFLLCGIENNNELISLIFP